MPGTLALYGTLRHLPLLQTVLGRLPEHESIRLPDHAVYAVEGAAYPMIAHAPGQMAEALLVRDLTSDDVQRLDFYEGGFGYSPAPVTAVGQAGRVTTVAYFSENPDLPRGQLWDFTEWVTEWGAISVTAAAEAMRHFGQKTPEEIAALLPFFRARACARQRAQASPTPSRYRHAPEKQDVEIFPKPGGYDGFFRMEPFRVRHRRFDGTMGPVVNREAFVAYDAALVLPYDPVTDQVLLIEQMRHGSHMRGDPNPWVFEPVAGLIDAGETPEETARREAVEEAGISLGPLRRMFDAYASPGYSTEFFYCYAAPCDLSDYQVGVNGLASESENIRSHLLPLETALKLIDTGEINAGPLISMLLWLAHYREELRSLT